MPSTMLEQAIVDANQLKEAAMKSAEAEVLKRYSNEIKEAVGKLLEQPLDDMEDSMSIGGMDMQNTSSSEDVLSQIPMAATDGEKLCQCPEEDEEIEIDFDQLAQMSAMDNASDDLPGQMNTPSPEGMYMEEGSPGIVIPASIGPDLHSFSNDPESPIRKLGEAALSAQSVSRELVEMAIGNLMTIGESLLEENDKLKINEIVEILKNTLNPISHMPTVDAGLQQESLLDKEELSISEEMIQNILETLEVDIENVPVGHPGRATTPEREMANQIELASLEDDKRKEEHEATKKAMAKFQAENQSLKVQLRNQIDENKKIKSIALKASNKLEELNVQNVKLTFKNRALESVSLNERQRTKIVEAVSKVSSVNEAKVIFETLYDSFTTKDKSSNAPQNLNEAINKNTSNFIKPKETTENNVDPIRERMLRLAGIKK